MAQMESLSHTTWDVVIAGTSLPQSLLALALSRSGKKVLHVDLNQYYGGRDAALTLEELAQWKENIAKGQTWTFSQPASNEDHKTEIPLQIAKSSRSYALNLMPQIIYARSKSIQALVSSQLHTQLEFLAVGSWWILTGGHLQKIPNGREDVFADDSLSRRDKIGLMKFLRYALQESEEEVSETMAESTASLETVLTSRFNIPTVLHAPLLALALSPGPAAAVSFGLALPRIRRHLQSIGTFGAGFGAVVPKYGGSAEIVQVACRAGAVGGGVYALGTGISAINGDAKQKSESNSTQSHILKVKLTNGEEIRTSWVVGSEDDLPEDFGRKLAKQPPDDIPLLRSISIISGSLSHLFPPISENGPAPAVAIVLVSSPQTPNVPVYFQVHSDEMEECPSGQYVLHGSTLASDAMAQSYMDRARSELLESTAGESRPVVLWSMSFQVKTRPFQAPPKSLEAQDDSGHVFCFPQPRPDLAFDDDVLADVKAVWREIMGGENIEEEFLRFEIRSQGDDDENDEV